MRLTSVRVQNYRSIVDSAVVQLSERVTVLVGKNEQGKTTFLRAMGSLNPKSRYSPGDLPNHLRASLEEKPPAEIPIIQAWLLPDAEEKKALTGILSDLDQIDEFIVARFYDAHYSYQARQKDGSEIGVRFTPPDISGHLLDLNKAAGGLHARLAAHGTRLTAFEPSVVQAASNTQEFLKGNFSDATSVANLFATYITALKALPGQDATIQADIASTTKEIETVQDQLQKTLARDPRAQFHRFIPRFVFHSTSLDRIPNEVNVADFVKDPDSTSKGMANLCLVAGLSTQKIQELASATEISRRETYEDHFRASISGGINEFWTQESYNVHFRIDREKLSLSISDSTYGRRISPSERSDGFQWYLSFYSALLSEVSSTTPTIMLLDNPGLELHADGQRDIKRFLEEKLPRNTQVAYVTHSPAMIDTFNLEQVRRVELRPGMEGTKVLPLAIGAGLDLLEPVRSAVGASLVTTLISNDFNVLVEGASDKPILEGAFALFQPSEHSRIVVNGSLSETGRLLPSFYERAHLPYAIYLDADSGGRDIGRDLITSGIPASRIVNLGDVVKRDGDFELEDIFHPEFYKYAVAQTYPDKELEGIADGSGKITKRYERFFGESLNIGFTKRRVAETAKRILLQNGPDAPDLDQLRALASRIWEVLRAR